MEHHQELPPQHLSRLTRNVVQNQLLFTAGYSLTTGGFLTYFAADLGARTSTLAWILTLPELVGLLAIFTPVLLNRKITKKFLFLTCALLARFFSLLIPLAVVLPASSAFPVFLSGFVLAGLLQAFSFTAYLSWLSELAPEQKWGRFFARRNMAHAAVLLILPFLAAHFRDALRANEFSTDVVLWSYVLTFSLGTALQLCSLIPLWHWPATGNKDKDHPSASASRPSSLGGKIATDQPHWPVSRLSYGLVLLFGCWLAFFQGLTQTAFFLHGYRQLQLSLSQYYALMGVMYGLQMLCSWGSGYWADRHGNRNLLAVSTLVVGSSLLFWIASLQGNWLWLWGAYLLWGGFGAVNLTLQNLVLTVIPREKNTFLIALFRFGSGGVAGLSGLLGGYWLDQQLTHPSPSLFLDKPIDPYLLLFVVSLLGRLLAPLWLIGVRESPQSQPLP